MHVGQQDVRLVLLADEVDADQAAHGAVRTVAAHHVARADRVASGDSMVTPSPSCVSPTTSAPRTISTPSSSARAAAPFPFRFAGR